MNQFLVNSFKELCNKRLAELIKSCYLLIEEKQRISNHRIILLTVCEIYTPSDVAEELMVYQEELNAIGVLLDIDFVCLLPIEKSDLIDLRQQAALKKSLNIWRTYLELQYLF
ncbi:MAG: hypothetical protein ACFBSE_26555 [Prochloraceae cyanobacterium]